MSEPEITPSDLKFRFQVNKQLPATISVFNPLGDRIAFKVKTTTPKKYVVRPSSGVVDSKSTANVQVIMQAQKEFPADFANCKDKFLVQTTVLTAGQEIDADTFKAPTFKDMRIRVVMDGPPAPPSPVPEVAEGEEDSSVGLAVTNSAGTAAAAAAAATNAAGGLGAKDSSSSALQQENQTLRAKLDRLNADYVKLQRQVGGTKQARPAAVGSILPVVLAAILAFLVGHYLQALRG